MTGAGAWSAGAGAWASGAGAWMAGVGAFFAESFVFGDLHPKAPAIMTAMSTQMKVTLITLASLIGVYLSANRFL